MGVDETGQLKIKDMDCAQVSIGERLCISILNLLCGHFSKSSYFYNTDFNLKLYQFSSKQLIKGLRSGVISTIAS